MSPGSRRPPTVGTLRLSMRKSVRKCCDSSSASHLAGSRYARWRSLLDHRTSLVGRVGKALWRLDVSRPHPRRAVGTAPGLDTLAGARYSTTESSAALDPTERRRTRLTDGDSVVEYG